MLTPAFSLGAAAPVISSDINVTKSVPLPPHLASPPPRFRPVAIRLDATDSTFTKIRIESVSPYKTRDWRYMASIWKRLGKNFNFGEVAGGWEEYGAFASMVSVKVDWADSCIETNDPFAQINGSKQSAGTLSFGYTAKGNWGVIHDETALIPRYVEVNFISLSDWLAINPNFGSSVYFK